MKLKVYKLIIVAVLLSIFLVYNPYKLIVVVGNSMYPSFKNNQILLAKKIDTLRKNDVVVIKSDFYGTIIKRIALIPGDHYYFYLDTEKIFIDNSYESISNFKKTHGDYSLFDFQLKENKYFVLGDNSNFSEDSRHFGPVEREDILYKVIN